MNTPIDPSYREITLTRGKVALVDEEDYESLIQWKWYAALYSTGDFYAVRSIHESGRSKIMGMHRQILGLGFGDRRHGEHRFHHTLDNRKFIDGVPNLRIATRSENMRNRGVMVNSSSGITGVRWYKNAGLWLAFICIDGKERCLGSSKEKSVAIELRLAAEREHYGEFAYDEGMTT